MGGEARIVNQLLEYLNTGSSKAIKIHGSGFMEVGTPDIIACRKGRMWAIEVKAPDGELSKIQRVRLTQWKTAGAISCVVTSLEEMKELIESGRGNW